MNKIDKIYVAGHRGMAGSSIVRRLEILGYKNIVFKTSQELDLRDQSAVFSYFKSEKPDYVFIAAAKVGGILANNTYRADFLYDNLQIQSNIISAAHRFETKKLLFLGSSCIYPKNCPQPIREEYLLSGNLEKTNEPYAIAKIAGLKLCEAYHDQYGSNFISIMPTNLYGPKDNYDLQNSHVLPALIRKFHDAKQSGTAKVTIWGSGIPMREFLHVDDLADACVYLMNHYDKPEPINAGWGKDISIKELALLIQNIVDYKGELVFDTSKPDGTLRKVLDTSKMKDLGWSPKISLREGIQKTYECYLQEHVIR